MVLTFYLITSGWALSRIFLEHVWRDLDVNFLACWALLVEFFWRAPVRWVLWKAVLQTIWYRGEFPKPRHPPLIPSTPACWQSMATYRLVYHKRLWAFRTVSLSGLQTQSLWFWSESLENPYRPGCFPVLCLCERCSRYDSRPYP